MDWRMSNSATQQLRASDIALNYARRGWAPIPVPFRAKGPQLKDWQTLGINRAEQIARYFRDPTNLGVILGEVSGRLVDIDVDCAEALEIAGQILPKTARVRVTQLAPGFRTREIFFAKLSAP
jgi:hypothetical protein